MANLRRPPTLTHIFQLTDGTTIEAPHRDAHRVIDRRTDMATPVTCWQVKLPSGIVRQIWPDEIRSWRLQER